MKKGRSITTLVALVVVMALLIWYTSTIMSATSANEKDGITLGLDLAGGVAITYQITDEDASQEDVADTVYKLQQRAQVHSTESSVYSSGSDRIYVEIPGVANADEILEDLRKQGTLEFQDPDGNTFMTGTDIVSAEAGSYKDSTYGNTQFCVNLVLSDEAAETFADMTGAHVGERLAIVYDGETLR